MVIKLDVLLVQLFHIAILFWVFRKLVWDSLTNAILARRVKQEKLDHAEAEAAKYILEAKAQADILVQEWLQHKKSIIDEAAITAEKKADDIIANAHKQAEKIKEAANFESLQMKQELEQNRTDGVKQTALVVVRKLFDKDVSLQQEYLDMLVKESGVK